MKHGGNPLLGIKAICDYTKVSEHTLMKYIHGMGFPAKKICGQWASYRELIDAWWLASIQFNHGESDNRRRKRMGSRLLVRYLEEHDWYCAEIKVDYQVYKHVTYSDKKISVPMDEEELGEAYLTDVARALEIPLADLLAFEKKPRGVQPPLSL